MARRPAPARSTAALSTAFVVCAAAIAVAAVVVKPTTAHSFHLLYGSVFVDDNTSPVGIDLASGKPTVRLSNAVAAVAAASTGDLDLISVGQATLMLDAKTGEFNMLDASGLLLKPTGGGVQLPDNAPGTTTAVAAGSDAYILRTTDTGTDVYLVGESTVASAIGLHSHTVPRAWIALPDQLAASPGSAASAGDDLWLLTGSARSHTLRQLVVPAGSDAGTTLTATAHGTITGPAAVEAVGAIADAGSVDAATTIAVASTQHLDLYRSDGSAVHLPHPAIPGLDRVLPVTNLTGRAAFLLHGTAGWSLLSATVHGARPVVQLRPLSDIPATAPLVTPAASGGAAFALRADGDGRLWAINLLSGAVSMVTGATTYPVLPGERLDLSGAQVLAEGSRVIVNARANFEAEVIFTDGSHPPLTVDKHSAVQLDPSSTEALVVSHQGGTGKAPSKSSRTRPAPAPTVNNRVDCRTADQNPHIPRVRLVQTGSRSVQVAWTYPLLDTQDCVPSTYTVAVRSIDDGAPAPPGTATVQGQDGVDLVGLFPNTDYRIVVTAYLNGRGTASAPLSVRTSAEGPVAPTGVTTTVDAHGNWTVTWQSCGGLTDTCVPSVSWQVTPRLCDGVGLSSTPQPMVVIGDPTQHTFTATYPATADLLGRGLSFEVAGVGVTGIVGALAADGNCRYSWTPPIAGDISVSASVPPATAEQGTTSSTVSVHFAGGQTADLGGVGGQLTYQLLSGGGVVASIGPTVQSTVTFTSIRPAVHYAVRLIAAPAHHPEAAVTIGPVDVQPAIAVWPQPTLTASFADTTASTGTLSIIVGLPAGSDTHGETFDLSGGSLDCGNAHLDLTYTNLTPGAPMTFTGVPRAVYNSASSPCTVTGELVQNAATALTPPLYGAGPSPAATSSAVPIDVPTLDTAEKDFTASWVGGAPAGSPEIAVSYSGSDDLLATYGRDWTLVASTDSNPDCGSSSDSPAGSPAVIAVDHSCVSSSATWSVAIRFSFFGATGSYSIAVSGTKPAPVDPSKLSFAAVWPANPNPTSPQVQLQYSGPYDDAVLSALDWTITVTSNGSPGVTCGSSTGYPRADGSGPNIGVDLSACPATTGLLVSSYSVHLQFTDPDYGASGSYTVTVSGTAPQ